MNCKDLAFEDVKNTLNFILQISTNASTITTMDSNSALYSKGTLYSISLCIFFIAYCYIVGFITSNISQVDKLWSITPMLYALIFAYHSSMDPRTTLMCVAICVWGIRLTLNFARRGGYDLLRPWAGEEDYRWAYVRKFQIFQMSKIAWELFHLGFICFFQHALILGFTMPIQVAYVCSGNAYKNDPSKAILAPEPLNIIDWVLFVLMISFVIGEGVADQQQYNYQEEKYRRINLKKEKNIDQITGTMYEVGFPHHGVWKYSRHPNYFCENSFWITCYLFSCSACGSMTNWSAVGSISLALLFKESIKLSESITKNKYLKYFSMYEQQVPYVIPNPFIQSNPILGYEMQPTSAKKKEN